jgi:NAD(P)-dependent dehydrogenase (short-subunit alcohol dehydrogenase family)
MQALAGRHALVTGGGGGIGFAIATSLAGQGAAVTVVGRNREKLDRVVSALGGALAVTADVTQAESVAAAFAHSREQFGPIDILVNVAGLARSARFVDTSIEDWDRAIAVNLRGVYLCCREVVGPMCEAGQGRIVNIASTAGLRGYRYVTAYCAAKHGIVGLTRALALEVADRGVTVNAVCPGYTETHLLEDSIANIVAKTGKSSASARAALLRDIPRGSFVTPAEVAETVSWLCRREAQAITGLALAVDGGELAG